MNRVNEDAKHYDPPQSMLCDLRCIYSRVTQTLRGPLRQYKHESVGEDDGDEWMSNCHPPLHVRIAMLFEERTARSAKLFQEGIIGLSNKTNNNLI